MSAISLLNKYGLVDNQRVIDKFPFIYTILGAAFDLTTVTYPL